MSSVPNIREVLSRTIMSQMSMVEHRVKKLFHEAYPELEKHIWTAIDSRDANQMRQIIKELDELT